MAIKGLNSLAHHNLFYVIRIAILIIVSAGPAFGQFVVQPMMIEMPAIPGQIIRTALQLQNHDPNDTVVVDLKVVELSQWEDGSWRTIGSDTDNFDISKLSSCSKWIRMNSERAEVKPLTIGNISLRLNPPAGIRGVFTAAITVDVQTYADIKDPVRFANITFQFVIPVIIHIQGRAPARKIEVGDLGMEFNPTQGTNPATTKVSLSVANRGGTYSRLRSLLRISGYFNDHWRELASRELDLVGILPGSELKMTGDLERVLPPGRYRVGAAVAVDGERLGVYEKEVEFNGDPSVNRVAADAALDLSQKDIVINSMPGAIRTTMVEVSNASDEAVNVKVAVALPPVLNGVTFGNYRGEDLNCTSWLDIQPREFTLDKNKRLRLRIIATMPNPEAIYPCYYAVLGLFATYADGQNAGLTTANVCVVNQRATTSPIAKASGPVGIALVQESKYSIASVFGNYGQIHFTPKRCLLTVKNPAGLPMGEPLLFSGGKSGLMLPFEFREYSGIIDFSQYLVGLYRVEVSFEYGDKLVVTNDMPIEITVEGERRIVTTLQQDEFQRRVGVKWR